MSIEPGKVKKIELDGKPIYVKSLSVRMFRQVLEAVENVQNNDGKITAVTTAIDLAKSLVVGWEGLSVPFGVDAFDDAFDWDRALEILWLCLSSSKLSDEERKKFE